jgi:hypothetical protein
VAGALVGALAPAPPAGRAEAPDPRGPRAGRLPQVVEGDLGLRVRGERGPHPLVGREVAKDAVADPAHRDRAELLLHGLEPVPRPGGAGQVEHHRVDAGEPPDGARQVHPGVHRLLAPVPLHRQPHPRPPRPARDRLGQRAEEDVVDLRAVRRGELLQERARLLRVQRPRDRRRRPRRDPLAVHREGRDALGPLRQPVRGLGAHRVAAGVLGQPVGPVAVRGALRAQLHRLAGLDPGAGALQVVADHLPRDGVDHQVVEDQQELAPARPAVEEDRAAQRAVLQVERRLAPVGGLALRARLLRGGEGGEVHPLQRDPGAVGVPLFPPGLRLPEAEPERVVVLHHRPQRGLQRGVGGLRVHGQEGALVVVPGRRAVLLEEPGLDRRQPRRALDALPGGARRPGRGGLARDRGQPGDGLVLEELRRGDLHPGAAGLGDHLDHQDAVAAELEERVVDAHAVEPEDLGPDLRQRLLHAVARGRVPRLGRRVLGRGERPAVHLPVRREREPVEDHHRGRDHVLGEPLAGVLLQLAREDAGRVAAHRRLAARREEPGVEGRRAEAAALAARGRRRGALPRRRGPARRARRSPAPHRLRGGPRCTRP